MLSASSERYKRWRKYLRVTTGLQGIMRYNAEQALRNTRELHRFLRMVLNAEVGMK